MKTDPHIVRIKCPCCPKKIAIDLNIFKRYRRLMRVARLADSHMMNFLYPERFKDYRLKLALDEVFGIRPHHAAADRPARTWKMYLIDLILSSDKIRNYLKTWRRQ